MDVWEAVDYEDGMNIINLGVQTQTFSLQDSKEEVQCTILCSS